MPTARKTIQRRSRRARRQSRVWTLAAGILSTATAAFLFFVLFALLGGAAVFSWLQQDFPTTADLANRFFAQVADEPSIIVAQDRQGEWQTIDTIIDPHGPGRAWQPVESFPVLAPSALRAYAPAFPGEYLRRQLEPIPKFNWPPLDRLIENAYQSQVGQQYSAVDEDAWLFNTAYYGHLAFGLEAAAQRYFQKPAADLTLAELALLLPIPLDPAINPIDDFAGAKQRQEALLQAMVDQALIDRERFVTARFSPLVISGEANVGPAPEFSTLVRRDAAQLLSPEELIWGGLTIYSTLDLDLQRQADCLARAHTGRLMGRPGSGLQSDEALLCPALAYLPELPPGQSGLDRDVDSAAVVVIDPRNGQVRALTGFPNGTQASSADRQPGSAFGGFTLVTALSQGLNAATMLLDIEQDFGTPYNGIAFVPQNSDGSFVGPLSLREALASDRVVPAVELLSRVGPENAVRNARRLGLNNLDPAPNRYGLSLAIGGGEVSVLQMAIAYGVLANGGSRRGIRLAPEKGLQSLTIILVEGPDGQVILEPVVETEEIVAAEIAYIANDMFSDRLSRCPFLGCPNVLELPDSRPAAVKIGTTNDYRDAWTIGYTPQLVTAVWVGRSNRQPMDMVTGQEGAAPIWQAVMGYALAGMPPELWSRPDGITERLVCRPSGLLATDICPARQELFIAGTEPTEVDTMFLELPVNRLNGRQATQDTPPEFIELQQFIVYPPEAASWVEANNIPQPPQDFDTLRLAQPAGDMTIKSPQPFAVVGGEIEIRGDLNLGPGDRYRISFYEGLSPTLLQEIVGERRRPIIDDLLGVWDTGSLEGLFSILVTVFRPDGSFTEVDIPVTIDRKLPNITLVRPFNGGPQQTSAGRVTIEVDAADEIGLARVIFSVDDPVNNLLAERLAPPFQADLIIGGRCQTVTITAIDLAGNESELAVGPICPANQGDDG